jgi:Ca2+-transporting ATPase
MMRLPLPLIAAQIIWLNLVTDGFLDVALAFEPQESNLLKHRPQRKKQKLFDSLMGLRIILMSIPMVIGTVWVFNQYHEFDLVKARTMALITMAAFQWFNAWNCRSQTQSVFRMNPFSNRFLIGALTLVVLLQVLVIYHPGMQLVFRTTALTVNEWLLAISLAATVLIGEEMRKFIAAQMKKIRERRWA